MSIEHARELAISIDYRNLEPLDKAMKLVTDGGIAQRKACSVAGIHRSQLIRQINAIKTNRPIKAPHRPPIFTPEQEQQITDDLRQKIDHGESVGFKMFQDMCLVKWKNIEGQNLAKPPKISRNYVNALIKKYDISFLKPRIIDKVII